VVRGGLHSTWQTAQTPSYSSHIWAEFERSRASEKHEDELGVRLNVVLSSLSSPGCSREDMRAI
jgi:hypothetical protein